MSSLTLLSFASLAEEPSSGLITWSHGGGRVAVFLPGAGRFGHAAYLRRQAGLLGLYVAVLVSPGVVQVIASPSVQSLFYAPRLVAALGMAWLSQFGEPSLVLRAPYLAGWEVLQ